MLKRENRRLLQLAIAVTMTTALITAWIAFEMSYAILPVLIFIQWIPFLPQTAPSHRTRFLLILLVGLTVLAVLSTAIFVSQNG